MFNKKEFCKWVRNEYSTLPYKRISWRNEMHYIKQYIRNQEKVAAITEAEYAIRWTLIDYIEYIGIKSLVIREKTKLIVDMARELVSGLESAIKTGQ